MISANATANAEHHDLDHLTGVKLPLVHRDKLSSSSSSVLNDEYRRARVLSGMGAGFGMDIGKDAYYLVTLGVGSPAIDQTLVMDTGSDLTWIQSKGCSEPDDCMNQPNERYDVTKSTSHQWVPCHSETCFHLLEKIHKNGCGDHDNQCLYKYEYADEMYSSGSLALETLTINGTAFPSVIVGCSIDTHIAFDDDADGLLGLGRGPLSYTTQPNGQTGRAFRFCLGENDKAGWLHFGYSNFPDDAMWASLISIEDQPSFYFIKLLRIEVDGKALDIPGDTFQIDTKTGKGGVIIDTGSKETYLPEVAYNALRDTVRGHLDSLFFRIHSLDIKLDTCYSFGSGIDLKSVTLPHISFIIEGMYVNPTPTIQLNATQVLRVVDDFHKIACFPFAPSTDRQNILAGRQLEGIQVTIDAFAGKIGFGPNGC